MCILALLWVTACLVHMLCDWCAVQRAALEWMLHREAVQGTIPHPFIKHRTTADGLPFYVNEVCLNMGLLSTCLVTASNCTVEAIFI